MVKSTMNDDFQLSVPAIVRHGMASTGRARFSPGPVMAPTPRRSPRSVSGPSVSLPRCDDWA